MPSRYIAFLLRLWPTGNPEKPTWLASLEDPHSRHVRGFGDIQALCEFLLNQEFLDKLEDGEESISNR